MKIIIACFTLLLCMTQQNKITKTSKMKHNYKVDKIKKDIEELKKLEGKSVEGHFPLDLDDEDLSNKKIEEKDKIIYKMGKLYQYAITKTIDEMEKFIKNDSQDTTTYNTLNDSFDSLIWISKSAKWIGAEKFQKYYKFLKSFEEEYRKNMKRQYYKKL